MASDDGRTWIDYSREATIWRTALSRKGQLAQVEKRLAELARSPELSLAVEHEGEVARAAFIKIDDGVVWGYKVIFVMDQELEKRARMPVIRIRFAKRLPYPRR